MRSTLVITATLVFLLEYASAAPAQAFRPPPRFSPPPRLPAPPPRVIIVPHVAPHTAPRPRIPVAAGTGIQNADPPGPSPLLTLAASTVGLLGSPLGDGPLLATATLFPPETVQPAPVAELAPPPVEWAARGPGAAFFIVPVVAGVFIIVGIIVAIGRAANRPTIHAIGRIRIAAVPPGEAPKEIRQAWVGLELPFVGLAKGRSRGAFGVLSKMPASNFEGYAVDGAEAVRILAAKSPHAAAWWRQNAPHILSGGYQLVFPPEVCQRIG